MQLRNFRGPFLALALVAAALVSAPSIVVAPAHAADVTAPVGQQTVANKGDHVIARGKDTWVIAQEGSVVDAYDGAFVEAQDGSIVNAFEGSRVDAYERAVIFAKKGSTVVAAPSVIVHDEYGANVTREID